MSQGDNKCKNCGQWAGRGHRCATPTIAAPADRSNLGSWGLTRRPSEPVSRESVNERVARAQALATQTTAETPTPAPTAIAVAEPVREPARVWEPGYDARVGDKYTGYRNATDIAKDVRADLKKAVKDGYIPSDVKISVRTAKGSMTQAINVRLSGWSQERIYSPEMDRWGMPGRMYTDEAKQVMSRVEAIRSAYNRSATNAQIDYFDETYYGTTEWDWR